MLKFTRNESGSSTIEFVLWIPFIFTFVLIAADATMAFMRQSQVWQVSRETARIVSRYGLTQTEADQFATNQLTICENNPDCVDVGFFDNGNFVVVDVFINANALSPFGIISFALDETIQTRVVHAMEPLT